MKMSERSDDEDILEVNSADAESVKGSDREGEEIKQSEQREIINEQDEILLNSDDVDPSSTAQVSENGHEISPRTLERPYKSPDLRYNAPAAALKNIHYSYIRVHSKMHLFTAVLMHQFKRRNKIFPTLKRNMMMMMISSKRKKINMNMKMITTDRPKRKKMKRHNIFMMTILWITGHETSTVGPSTKSSLMPMHTKNGM
jgi:hypothetical protein